jgi:predicted porin
MQKKLIALAVAGLVSTGAYAQTAVTVYGVADLSFDNVKTSGGATNAAQTGSYSRVSTNGSYLGFKGSEDLGNGLKAVFQFENAVVADGAGMFGGARDTFVGLESAFGSLKLGTLTTPTRALGTATDVNVGAQSIGYNGALINLLGFDTRQTNTALFNSANYGGFSVAAAYIAGENKSANAAAGTAAQADADAWDLGATYKAGPLMVGATYAQGKARDTIDSQVKNTRLAGAFDFGAGSVRALYNRAKTEANVGADTKQNTWGIGGTFNAAPNGKLITQYYKLNNLSGTSNTGAKLFELGYEHSFSKRTMLKVIYARLNNEAAAALNFGNNGVNNVAAGVDPSGFQIGMRHSF